MRISDWSSDVCSSDLVDLVDLARAHLRGVEHQEGVHDRVDPGGLHDAGEDRVALVAAHELGALKGDRGLVAVEADDDVDRRVSLEGLGDPAAPEGAETGDEDALAHAATRTRPTHGGAACRRAPPGSADVSAPTRPLSSSASTAADRAPRRR